MLRPSIFVPPCEPIQRDRPPKGEAWLHEVKFDGYRMQIHKVGRKVTIFTRNGHDWTDRFPHLAAKLAALPTCVIDAELVAIDATGVADFATLRRTVSKRQEDGLALWAFDLLYARGRDIRAMPYIERKRRLASLLARADFGVVSHSEFFAGGDRLLAACGTPRPRRYRLQAVRQRLPLGEANELDQSEVPGEARGQPGASQAF